MTRETVNFGYTRLSNDPAGLRADHETQNRSLDQLEIGHGLPARRAFTDDDTSASKAEVIRPGYQAMLAEIARLDRKRFEPVVTAYSMDRLTRQVADTMTLVQLLDGQGGRLITASQGPMSVVEGGRQSAILTGAIGQIESETIGKRTRDGKATAAMAGKPGCHVPYGWTPVVTLEGSRPVTSWVVDEEAAAIVNECVSRTLAGWSMRRIARDLDARGVPTPGAQKGMITKRGGLPVDMWTGGKVRTLVMRPVNVAIRVHRQAKTGSETRYAGTWPPIVDESAWLQACAILGDESRKTARNSGVRYLASTIARCGICGGPMTGNPERVGMVNGKQRTWRAMYRCQWRGHLTRDMANVDRMIHVAVVQTCADPEIRAILLADDPDEHRAALDERAAAVALQAEFEADRLSGAITREQFLRMNAGAQARIDAADVALARRRGVPAFDQLLRVSPGAVEMTWDAMTLDRQRAVVASLLDIRIMSSRAARFDSASVKVTLKGLSEDDRKLA